MTLYSDKEAEQFKLERDLYWHLLELGLQKDLGPFLKEALSLIIKVTKAEKGFLAIYQDEQEEPYFSLSESCSKEEEQEIREKISHGIIAQAMASGQTIHTGSAIEDERFQGNRSVLAHSIESVLCAPIGVDEPLGVIYLQDRPEPFTEDDRRRAETFARHIAPFVERLLQSQRQREESDPTSQYRKRLRVSGIIGRSVATAELLRQVEAAAGYEVSVLLTGPSGTGKTILARAIHENSARAKGPFVELNCAALPEGLFESELFGAVAGGHSTATRKMVGKLAAAEGGTLFLDEIGELSLNVQSKLLQFLQSKEFFPLGSTKPEKADVRVLAATNRDLPSSVAQKSFREDLFYRLNVLPLRVPSLQERREDIPLLLRYLCEALCKKHKATPLRVSVAAERAASTTPWPGNIRQLAHGVEAALIRAFVEKSPSLEIRHLFPEAKKGPSTPPEEPSFQEVTRRFQREHLLKTLESTQWNLSETARRLQLTRSHIHNLLQAFELRAFDPRKK